MGVRSFFPGGWHQGGLQNFSRRWPKIICFLPLETTKKPFLLRFSKSRVRVLATPSDAHDQDHSYCSSYYLYKSMCHNECLSSKQQTIIRPGAGVSIMHIHKKKWLQFGKLTDTPGVHEVSHNEVTSDFCSLQVPCSMLISICLDRAFEWSFSWSYLALDILTGLFLYESDKDFRATTEFKCNWVNGGFLSENICSALKI